jgi:hypothetical protein
MMFLLIEAKASCNSLSASATCKHVSFMLLSIHLAISSGKVVPCGALQERPRPCTGTYLR